MCCSMTQLSVKLHQDLCQRNRGELAGAWLRLLLPKLRLLRSTITRGIVAYVQSFAVWYGTTACVHVPIHSRNTAGSPSVRPMAAMSAFRQLLPAQHPWPCVSPASPVEARISHQLV